MNSILINSNRLITKQVVINLSSLQSITKPNKNNTKIKYIYIHVYIDKYIFEILANTQKKKTYKSKSHK